MKLQTKTLRFQIKQWVFPLITFFLSVATAQSQDLKAHKKAVQNSRLNKTSLLSRDTLYCSGNPVARVHEVLDKETKNSRVYFYPLQLDSLSLIVSKMSRKVSLNDSTWYMHFNFKGIQMNADVKWQEGKSDPMSLICKNNLFNIYGLDTSHAEIFCTLNKVDTEGSQSKKTDLNKSIIPDRDFLAPILIEEDKVAQGGILIATYELDTIASPLGNIEQYAIYNSIGALVCSATITLCSDKKSKSICWSLLTYKNSRFHKIETKGEDNLGELIQYLIQNKFI